MVLLEEGQRITKSKSAHPLGNIKYLYKISWQFIRYLFSLDQSEGPTDGGVVIVQLHH